MLNPGSGPGNNTLSDPNFQREIPKLNTFPNIRTIGYVRIGWTKRDINVVLNEVSTYASWADVGTKTSFQIHGIFFDETPNNYTDSGVAYLQRIDQFVKGDDGFAGVNYVNFPYTGIG